MAPDRPPAVRGKIGAPGCDPRYSGDGPYLGEGVAHSALGLGDGPPNHHHAADCAGLPGVRGEAHDERQLAERDSVQLPGLSVLLARPAASMGVSGVVPAVTINRQAERVVQSFNSCLTLLPRVV
jgi:hypothetical protein